MRAVSQADRPQAPPGLSQLQIVQEQSLSWDVRGGFVGGRCHRDERGKERKPGEIAVWVCMYLCRRNRFKMSFGVLEKANRR